MVSKVRIIWKQTVLELARQKAWTWESWVKKVGTARTREQWLVAQGARTEMIKNVGKSELCMVSK